MIKACTVIPTPFNSSTNKGDIYYNAWVEWSEDNKDYDYFVEEDNNSFEKLYKKKNTISFGTTTYILLVEVKIIKEMEILVDGSLKTITSEVEWGYKSTTTPSTS